MASNSSASRGIAARSKITGAADPIHFHLDSRRVVRLVLWGCVGFEVLLFVLDWIINFRHGSSVRGIRRLFNTAREDSLASWFSTTQTFVVGLVLWLNYAVVRKIDASRWRRIGWMVLALLFTFMAIDDGAQVHERVGSAIRGMASRMAWGWVIKLYPSYAWHILFVPFFGAMGLFMLYFLWTELPRRGDRMLIGAALAIMGVAIVLDYLEGLENGYAWVIQTFNVSQPAAEHFSKSIEECLEMLGMTIFLVVFLRAATRLGQNMTFRFR